MKTPAEIEKMRAAGRVAREVLDIAGRAVRAGITTDEIDNIVHEETLRRGAYPSPLNYHGFPKSCCTSVNEVSKEFVLYIFRDYISKYQLRNVNYHVFCQCR